LLFYGNTSRVCGRFGALRMKKEQMCPEAALLNAVGLRNIAKKMCFGKI
jgi:hypothetical protein